MSQAGATGGNYRQIRQSRNRLKQANPQPSAAHGNGPAFDGKEGVDGSSPSEGFGKAQQMALFSWSPVARTILAGPESCPQDRSPPLRRARSLASTDG